MISKEDQKTIELMLAKWLANLREDKGLSQEALGTQIGKSQSDIAKIESGKKKLTVVELIKWFEALGLPLEKLLDGFDPIYRKISGTKSLWGK